MIDNNDLERRDLGVVTHSDGFSGSPVTRVCTRAHIHAHTPTHRTGLTRNPSLCVTLAFLLAVLAVPALAHDGEHDAWYGSLMVHNRPTWAPMMKCCDRDDCRPVLSRLTDDGHWQAYIDSKTFPDNPKSPPQGHAPNAWVDVRDDALITDQGNPIGSAVACWWSRDVLCLIPPVEM